MSKPVTIDEILQSFWFGCMLSSSMPLERIEGDSVKEAAKTQAKQAIEAYIAERENQAQIEILANILVYQATGRKHICLSREGVVAVLANLQRDRQALWDKRGDQLKSNERVSNE